MRSKLRASLRLCVRSRGQDQLVWTFHPDGARAKRIAILCVLWFLCATLIHVIRGNKIINMIKQMKQFHLIGTDVRRVRPQSIKISQLNVREIKDDRTSVPAKCTFLQFRKNLFHLYNLLINNYWHTEFTHRKAHTLRCAGTHAKRRRTLNVERWKFRGDVSFWGSEVLRFWSERWTIKVER